MSEGRKLSNRPKVRFCQREDDAEDQEYDTNQRILAPLRKPSIKSIIPIENPYRIVSLEDDITSKKFPGEGKSSTEIGENRFENLNSIFGHQKRILHDFDEEGVFPSTLRKFPDTSPTEKRSSVELAFPRGYEINEYKSSSLDSSFSSKEETVNNPKIVEVDVHAEDLPQSQIQNEPKTQSQEAQTVCNSQENFFDDQEIIFNEPENSFEKVRTPEKKNLSAIPEESLEIEMNPKTISLEPEGEPEPLKIPEELKLITKKVPEPKSPRKNFKCTSPLKRQLNSINRLSKSVKSPRKSSRESSQNATNSKIRGRPLGFIQRSATRPKVCGVMPCMKAKMAAKGKTSPVKKTVLRNVVKKPPMVIVEPGVTRPRKELKVDFEEKPRENIQKFNPERLSKPEYNSIMCTINKLKEVQKENIITDMEHLPPVYKSLINGKVANSLDFPPDESIFKNLINLSIDETQLPTRMIRSKDPEPRQRDAVPKLSDFFVPRYANEYCTAVCPKPRSAEPVENWSAFRISDKIRSWKWNLDFVH